MMETKARAVARRKDGVVLSSTVNLILFANQRILVFSTVLLGLKLFERISHIHAVRNTENVSLRIGMHAVVHFVPHRSMFTFVFLSPIPYVET